MGNSSYPLINLESLSYTYPLGKSLVIDKLNLKVFKGDKIGLFGSNGSGKTTLFHLIMGLIEPVSGTIKIFNKPVKSKQDFKNVYKKIGILFQDSDDQLFCPTVIEDVAFGPLNLGKSKDEAVKIAKDILDFLGLKGFEDRITHKLSGGEKRLVALSTVLAMKPDVILLDEPSTGLDNFTKEKITGVLKDLDLTYLVISHENDFLLNVTDTVCVMENGRIIQNVDAHQYLHKHPHPLAFK